MAKDDRASCVQVPITIRRSERVNVCVKRDYTGRIKKKKKTTILHYATHIVANSWSFHQTFKKYKKKKKKH